MALDPGFATAWAQLSRVHSNLYFSDASSMRTGVARQARQQPSEPWRSRRSADGYMALGDYYSTVESDHLQAIKEYARGHQFAPKDARLLTGAATSELGLGRAGRRWYT